MFYALVYDRFGWLGLVGVSSIMAVLLCCVMGGFFYFYYFCRRRAELVPSYRPDPAELRHALRWSLFNIVGNALLILPIQILIIEGHSRLYSDLGGRGWLYVPLSFAGAILFAETAIYWIHRGLHTRLLYRLLHRYHHHYREPNPAASFAFHPFDSFAQSSPYHLFAFLLPMQEWAYIGLIAMASIWTLLIHNRVVWVPPTLINNTGCHTAHHWYYRYNYGNYFTLWDRIGGTYFDPVGLPERFFASKYGWRSAAAGLTDAGSTPPIPAP